MNLLIITDWTYPCDEPFMREVYAKRWQDAGHHVTWVMRPSDHYTDTRTKWRGSSVYIAPESFYSFSNLLPYVDADTIDWLESIWEREGGFDIIQVRNDLTVTKTAQRVANNHQVPLVFRHSHPKAETLQMGYKKGAYGYGVREYIKGLLGRELRDRLLNKSDAVFTISPAMSQYHAKNRGIDVQLYPLPMGADTSISPTDIDSKPFCSQYGLEPGTYLLYIGSMNPLRNLEFLFEVLKIVQKTHPDVHLAMVGGRNQDARERLRTQAKSHGVCENTIFTGWVGENKLQQAIVGAAIGLSPLPTNDVFEMNSPTKVLEYLNLETPAITSRTPEQVEMIESNTAGLAVEYSPKAFANAVTKLLDNPQIRQEMGEAGREYVIQERSYDAAFKTVEETYRKLITQC